MNEKLIALQYQRDKLQHALGRMAGSHDYRRIIEAKIDYIDKEIEKLAKRQETTSKGYVKHPRTRHLPWSLGINEDDVTMGNDSYFHGKKVVVTAKMDGENTTMYKDHIHARSINSKGHPSRDWVKGLHAGIAHLIPEGMRICGENMFAKHSIHYQHLDSYFLVHSIWFKKPNHGLYKTKDVCLSWTETEAIAAGIGLLTVPVLYKGKYDQKAVKELYKPQMEFGDEMEGYVVRVEDAITMLNYRKYVGKFVRKDHVQTEDHWMHSQLIKNGLRRR